RVLFFFFQAEDGIRDATVTGVQTCALPIYLLVGSTASSSAKFAVLNVSSGTPTASVSAGTAGAASLTATGVLATTAKQTLSLGRSEERRVGKECRCRWEPDP